MCSREILRKFDVEEIARKKIRRDHELIDYEIGAIGKVNGFLGNYHTLRIVVKTDNGTRGYKFFVKTLPNTRSPQHRFVVETNLFNKEVNTYDKIIPSMKDTCAVELKFSVDCYRAKEDEVIVLEDVSERGYVMPDKYVPFDFEHCAIALETLAQFHAGSFILEEKSREYNSVEGTNKKTVSDFYDDVLGEPLFNDNPLSRRSLEALVLGTSSMIDLLGINNEAKTGLKVRIEKWIRNMWKLLEPSTKFRNVICHRDVWANNFLFKYGSTGKPERCYLIDYQFIRYSPPAIDYLELLYLTTDRRTRDEYRDSFFDAYYENLRKYLNDEGLRIEGILDRGTFLESCEALRPTVLVYSIANLPIMLLDSETSSKYFSTAPELLQEILYEDRSPLVCQQFSNVRAYRERVTEVLLEAHETLGNFDARESNRRF